MNRAEGFAAVPNWMIREKRVPRNAVLVYASLASRSGLGGIHPSQATLAEESGLSERTVRNMLGELERLGVVLRIRRTTGKRGKGNRLPDGYTLHPNGPADLPADVAGSNLQPESDVVPTGNEDASNRQDAATHSSIEVEPVEVEPDEVAPRKRGSRIPEPFMLTAEMKAWAASEVPGLDVVAHTREFVDHWRAASGASASKRDWVAAWRNWLRKARRWQQGSSKPDPVDRLRDTFEIGQRLQVQQDEQAELSA